MKNGLTVAVVGAGLVGERLVAELKRRDFPLKELRVLARSEPRATLAGEEFEVGVAKPDAFEGVDLALFAGTEGEKGSAVQLAREAIARGAIVVDNESDFRLDPKVPLVVPEVKTYRSSRARRGPATFATLFSVPLAARSFFLPHGPTARSSSRKPRCRTWRSPCRRRSGDGVCRAGRWPGSL